MARKKAITQKLAEIYRQYERCSSVVGISLGPKVVAGVWDKNSPPCLSFLVGKKQPRKGRLRKVANGDLFIPGKVSIDGQDMPTDVVELQNGQLVPQGQPGTLTAGGPVGNATSVGTFGCLVKKAGSPFHYALTNRHVAIDTGQIVYFPSRQPGAIAAYTQFSAGLMPDETVLPFINNQNAYIEIDAALVTIPEPVLSKFNPTIPMLGRPTGIYATNLANPLAYLQSVMGVQVGSYSWNSGVRSGTITNVLYTTRPNPNGPIISYTLLIQGNNGVVPSISRDSGKAWVTASANGLELIGLHTGAITLAGQVTPFAVATDFSIVARLFGITPA